MVKLHLEDLTTVKTISKKQTMPRLQPVPIIGNSPQTQELVQLIRTLAHSSSTVLITGESGTGKELVAQALHQNSPRSKGAFVPINCGAIPRELIESELFGHRKGAFTGALSDRVGRFELAQGGTIFLDEIGDLPLDMQVKLLRVLQERCVEPVGSSKPVPIDVRVIAATHKNLEQAVAEGKFREDLYYRLNVLPCKTTALRDRPLDVLDLLQYYAVQHAPAGYEPIRFAPCMTQALLSYAWPGNVRELSNLVDRFTTLFPGAEVQLALVPVGMLPAALQELRAQCVPAAVAMPQPVAQPDWSAPLTLVNSADPLPMFDAKRESFVVNEVASKPTEVSEAAPVDLHWLEPTAEAEDTERNVVEEIICLAQGMMDLPEEGIALKQQLVNIERSLIEQALRRTNGNVSQTARLLQLQRTTLIEKINKYELRVA
jgi:sigma-54 dependent transcriptional regulator, flagellar regulatory protein